MRKFLPLLLLVSPLFAEQAEEQISYNKHIRPILSENCFYCHGQDPKTREADVALHLAEFAYKDNDGSTPIIPHNAKDSEVILRIFDEDDPMPPADSNRSLSAKEKELIKKWIEQGAKYEDHWSFVPPVKPDVPTDEHPVDHFIKATLSANELAPAPKADLPTLARRASLALTGLQPTPAQLDQLISHGSYEKFVDELLASDAYAERMSLHWLDASRYADTDGYQNDGGRSNWPWRDWVIKAYRENMPFDQFTIEQIAGDMLPNATPLQKLASAFNRNHRQNNEGGALAAEFYVENVVDRVETTSAVWLGLTTGCARCHDHKYDPISQREFFQLFSYFNNIGEKGTGAGPKSDPIMHIGSPLTKRPAKLQAKLDEATERLAKARATLPERLKSWVAAHQKIETESDWYPVRLRKAEIPHKQSHLEKLPDDSYLFHGDKVKATSYKLSLHTGKKVITGLRIDALPHGTLKAPNKLSRAENGNFVLTNTTIGYHSKRGQRKLHPVKIARVVATHEQSGYPASAVIDDDKKSGWAINGIGQKKASLFLIFEKPIVPENNDDVRITLEFGSDFPGHQIGRFRVLLTQKEQPSTKGDEAIPPHVFAALKANDQKVLAAYHEKIDPILMDAIAHEKDVQKHLTKAGFGRVPVMVMREKKGKPMPAYLLNRGQYDEPVKDDPLPRGVIAKLLPEGAKHPKDRLEFAKWLVSRENPITARVVVNRMWQRLFGIGLVNTPEDFGLQGELPSHPELLDWLAVEFIESGWDIKKMYRLLATSHAFTQSSKSNSLLNEKDPKNRLLARGPRYRMDGFALRDMALHASGLLYPKLGGRPVKPYQPKGLWETLAANAGTRYIESKGKDLYRKSMYSYWKRAVNPPLQLIFDAGGREVCNVRQNVTNTSLQALALMNEKTFLEASRKLAERMIREGGDAPLAHGYRLAKGHDPDPETLAILQRNNDTFQKHFADAPKEADEFLTIGESERDDSIDLIKLAAHAATAHLILNLDEVITLE